MYKKPIYLTEQSGNNAFAWEERGPEPRLYVPALIDGSLDDVMEGEEVVFADLDEHGVLQQCKGLKHFVRTQCNGTETVIFDNHNHAFYFWYEALERGLIERGAGLLHVDQHKDMRRPELLFDGNDAFNYTNQVLNVGNYIVPAVEEGLIGEVTLVTGEAALLELKKPDGPYIFNLDLDFFAPELDYIDFERAVKILKPIWEAAVFATVATSPFFIEQSRAIELLRKLT
jgi:hypothetical protein